MGALQKAVRTAKESHAHAASSDGRQSLGQGSNPARRIRAAFSRNLQISVALLSDLENRSKCLVISVCSPPVLDEYSEQSVFLRSTGEAKEWLVKQAAGALNDHLCAIMACLSDPARLSEVGLVLDLTDQVVGLADTHPIITQQAGIANSMGRFSLELLSKRVLRLCFFSSGWQGKQCRLLGPGHVQQQAVDSMRQEHEAFVAAEAQRHPWWQALARRSHMCTTSVVQLVLCLQTTKWQPTQELRDLVANRPCVVNQSKIVEDLFCVARKKENRQSNKIMADKSLWHCLVRSRVASETHRFDEWAWQDAPVQSGDAGRLCRQIFKPPARKADPNFKSVAGFSQRPAWHTSNVASSNATFAEMQLMLYAHKTGARDKVREKCGLSFLCRAGSRICISKIGSDKWYFVLSEVSGKAVIGWLAVAECRADRVQFFQPSSRGRPEWLVLVDEQAWRCCTVVWKSPAEQVVRQPQLLLKETAQACLWELPRSVLYDIGRIIGASCQRSTLVKSSQPPPPPHTRQTKSTPPQTIELVVFVVGPNLEEPINRSGVSPRVRHGSNVEESVLPLCSFQSSGPGAPVWLQGQSSHIVFPGPRS